VTGSPAQKLRTVEQLAQLRAELGEYDRAMMYYQNLAETAKTQKEKAKHYERLANIVENTGDSAATEEYFRKAIELGGRTTRFNFALWLKGESRPEEGLAVIDEAIADGEGAVRHILRAQLLRDALREEEALEAYQDAKRDLLPVSERTDWELQWLIAVATQLRDDETLGAAKNELKKRRAESDSSSPGALLPDFGS